MDGYQPYHETFRRAWDFRVKYDFLPLDNPTGYQNLASNGESYRLVYQGTRFDFRYPNEGEFKNSSYIIWPEFEDRGGFLILDKWVPIEPSGTARMWVVNKDFTEYHRQYLKVGTKGYMIKGNSDIAVCEVIELDNIQ